MTTTTSAATGDLHGGFKWSCNHEHGDDRYNDPTFQCSIAIVAGTDQNGDTHAYGLGCVEDLIVDPGAYAEQVELHGTHELTDEQLAELSVGGEILMRRGPDGNLPAGTTSIDDPIPLNLGDDDESDWVVAGVNANNDLVVISILLFHEYAKDPDRMVHDGVVALYGTHVLSERMIDYLFGDDED